LPGFFDQGDGVYVAGQAVEVGAVATGKTLQFVEGVFAIKKFGVKFKGGVVGITAGAAAGGLLVGGGVGGGVCAQEKLGIAAGGGMNQRLLMDIALENGQAVKVGANASSEHGVAVKEQMLGGNGGGNVGARRS